MDIRLRKEILRVLEQIPAGRVVTHATLAAKWNVPIRLIVQVMGALTDHERQGVPWHRVVAPGGAIGRHPLREEQIARLKAEGIPVAPAGIVHELGSRAVQDLDHPGRSPVPVEHPQGPSRSRGMKSAAVVPRKPAT